MLVTLEKVTTWPQTQELRRLRNECREYMTGDTAEISTARQVIFYEQQILTGKVHAILLRKGKRAVAYGLLRPDGLGGWWMSCGVTETERGQGLGTAVVRQITAMGSDTGDLVRLMVWQDNEPARRAYLKAGYVITGQADRNEDGRIIETMEHR